MHNLPSRSALLSQLGALVTSNLRELGMRRSDLPAILGFPATTQPAKCLRRVDAICAGNMSDTDMIDRIIASEIGGEDVANIIEQLQHLETVDRRERELLADRRAREAFIPHIHAIHERRIPEHPFFVIAMLGIDHFKRVNLPSDIIELTTIGEQLQAVLEFLDHVCSSADYYRITGGPFGRATQLLFRDSYEHAYVYDVATRYFVGEYDGVPRTGTATLSLKGRAL